MTENKRFTVKPQDDLFAVVDNNSIDKVCVVNGIRTEIETEWLCELLNELNDKGEFLEIENESLEDGATRYAELYHKSLKENKELKKENKKLKKVIEEDGKLIQSIYDELTKLRRIKKNLEIIKAKWDWIMEAIQYD